jgi:RND family efflux transporter MFP subunit
MAVLHIMDGARGKTGGWVLAGLGGLALVAAGWWLWRPASGGAAGESRPPFVLPVTLTRVERGDLRPRALLSGTVRSENRARLAFEVDGIVRELLAAEAEAVPAGSLLARLENRDEELALASAEAALALAERELERLAAGEREEEKRRLAAVVEASRAEEDLARSEVERGEKLLASLVISESEHDRRISVHRAAERRRAAVEEQYAQALAGTRLEDLAVSRARVDSSRTQLATARHELEKTELHAPWGGSVVRRFVSPGDYVHSGDPIFELAELSSLEVHLEVPGRLAGSLGSETRVRLRLFGQEDFELETELDALVPAADELARSFRAIVRLTAEDNRLGLLRPGMFVDVELLLEPVRDALLVPSDAVLASESGARLVRASSAPDGPPDGLVAEFVPVVVRAQEGGRSAVESLGPPLAEGDQLVLVGADNAFPGAPLALRAPGDAAGPQPGGAGR